MIHLDLESTRNDIYSRICRPVAEATAETVNGAINIRWQELLRSFAAIQMHLVACRRAVIGK